MSLNAELQKLRIDKAHKPRRESRAKWPWILLFLLLAAGGAAAWQYQKTASIPTVETLRIRIPDAATAASAKDDLVVLQATGYIIAAHKIELASKVIGRVAWIGVEMGDKVKQGQVLVRLEDDDYKARVDQQQGMLDSAKAKLAELQAGARPEELAQMQAQYDRTVIQAKNAVQQYQRLVSVRDTRTPAEIEDAEANMKAQQAQSESMKQQLDLMKAGTRKEQIDAQAATVRQLAGSLDNATIDLTNTVIRSPIDGTVLERNVEVGEFVTNGFVGDRGAKGYVVSLADLNDLLVELDISQNHFAAVVPNGPCWIVTDAYPDRKYEGRVERISPLANRTKATVLVRVQVLHPDGLLRPDMNATVSFLSPTNASPPGAAPSPPRAAVRIPASALHDGSVFIVENNTAKRLSVTPGLPTANGDIEITHGLIGGEDLILAPPESLKDGDPVKTRQP
jgi:HlyD family secretion protein